MTYLRYGKRRYVPAQCPVCRTGALALDGSLSTLLKAFYAAWNIVLVKRDPFWKVPQWYGRCGKCVMDGMIFSDSSLLSRLKKYSGNCGTGTIQVPLKYGEDR